MIIGVPKEIKPHEDRVGMVPSGVSALVQLGHRVLIESGAGIGSGIPDEAYVEAGGEIVKDARQVYESADIIVKVKEPLPAEYGLMHEGQVIYTFLHLAAAPELAEALIKAKVIAIGYETIQEADGSLPLLVPMSEVAGRLSVQVGARCLQRDMGGRGVLLGGVPGVKPGRVLVLGAGTVGTNAARIAMGMGADVTVCDTNVAKLRRLDEVHGVKIHTLISTPENVSEAIKDADLVIGSVLIPGARAPRLVTRDMVKLMAPGSVIVDVAIDQGGCVETARPTTHADPTFVVEGVIHYCVTNMPAVVARTSTFALTGVTLPYLIKLVSQGVLDAIRQDKALAKGVNVYMGLVTHPAVANDLGYRYLPIDDIAA